MRTHIALATSFCLALAAGPALAQNPSYEGRGYGGPLYVGPNFEQGGQHAPPVYGTKPAKKRAAIKPPRETPKAARKVPSKKDTTPDTTEQKADQASSSVASPSRKKTPAPITASKSQNGPASGWVPKKPDRRDSGDVSVMRGSGVGCGSGRA